MPAKGRKQTGGEVAPVLEGELMPARLEELDEPKGREGEDEIDEDAVEKNEDADEQASADEEDEDEEDDEDDDEDEDADEDEDGDEEGGGDTPGDADER